MNTKALSTRLPEIGLIAAGSSLVIVLAVLPSYQKFILVLLFLCFFTASLMQGFTAVFLIASLCGVFFIEVTLGAGLSETRGLSFMNVALGCSLVYLAIRNLRLDKKLLQPSPLNIPLLLLALYSFFSMILTYVQGRYALREFPGISLSESYLPGTTLRELLSSFKNELNFFFIYLIAFNLPRSKKEIRAILCLLVGFFIVTNLVNILGFYGVVNFISYEQMVRGHDLKFAGAYEPGFRLRGTLREPNIFASFLVLYLPLLISAVLNQKKALLRSALLGSLFLSLFVLLLTGSRGGYVGLLVAFSVFLLLLRKIRMLPARRLIVFIAVTAILVGLIVLLYPDIVSTNVIKRFTPKEELDINVMSHQRLTYWRVAVGEFFDQPLFGRGWKNSFPSHNNFLYYLMTLGVVGFGIYAVIFLKMARLPLKKLSPGQLDFNNLTNISFLAGLSGFLSAMFFVEVGRVIGLLFLLAGIVLRSAALRDEDGEASG
jgi:O-antigen ligase